MGLHDTYWWQSDKPHSAVFDCVSRLDEDQSYISESYLKHLRLYSNRLAYGLNSRDYTFQDSGEKLRLNLVRSVIDTATAHIATNRPRPMFITFDGDQKLRSKAKGLDKFVNGQLYANKAYQVSLQVFRDACIFGTGYLKVYQDGGRICSERVFPDEILIDDQESRTSSPRQMFHHKDIDIDVACAQWPDRAEEIRDSKLIRDSESYNRHGQLSKRVSIVESWHLPSSDDADDGRHVIAVSGGTLVDEAWKRHGFPFAVFRWSESPLGWHGVGLAEELTPIQVEVNYLLQKIQRLMQLATSQVWIRKGSGVNKSTLSNQDWGINEYKDQPPIHLAVQSVSGEYFAQVDRLESKAYSISGVSQLHSQSKKPTGLNSGTALLTYNDIASQRFQHVGQRWEQFFLDIAELYIECAREAEEEGVGDIRVLARGDKSIEEISFSEVSIDRDKYAMRVFPTSMLPDTPAGKLQAISELGKAVPGMQQYLMHLLDMPDLDNVRSLMNAPIDLVDQMIDGILERGEFTSPLPFMDLRIARERGTLSLLRAYKNKADPDRIELLRRWLSRVDKLQSSAASVPASAPPEAAPAEAPPDGMQALQ